VSNASCVDARIEQISLNDLAADPNQPRRYFDPDKLAELTDSIKIHGIIVPLLYREENERKILVSGECRYKAAKELDLETVPAQKVLRDYEFIALAENITRNTLTPMEKARAVSNLKEKHGDQVAIAKRLGLAESTVSEIVKPCELPEDMQEEALKSGFWSRNKLLKLAKAKPAEREKLFEAMKKDVARKEASKLAKREVNDDSAKQKKPKIDAETKKTQVASRKINAIKKIALLFSQRMQK
jgi:ParB family chromosome partitioning protein